MKEHYEMTLIKPQARSKPRRDNDGLHKRRGIWHYKLKIDGRWRERSAGTTNYRDAKKIRRQALQAQEEGRLPTDAARAKLEVVAKKWLGDREKLVAHQTWRIDKERLKPLERSFGHRRLCDITSDDIRAYQIKRAEEVSNRTVNLEIKVLRQILKRHKLWARIADDYTRMREYHQDVFAIFVKLDLLYFLELMVSRYEKRYFTICSIPSRLVVSKVVHNIFNFQSKS